MGGTAFNAAVVFPGYRPPDAYLNRIVTLAEHLAHQPQSGEGPGEQGEPVEEHRVAAADMDRQHCRACGACQTDKAALPVAIADAGGPQPRHLAGGEHDQCALGKQMLTQAPQLRSRRAALHVVDRQQQRAQGLNCGQEIVGHHFDIGANAAHQLQQCQTIQGANRVVGDDHHAAAGGNAAALAVAHLEGKVEPVERLFDEIETLQVRIARGKVLEVLELKQALQTAHQGAGGARVAREEVRVTGFQGALQVEHLISPPC